MSCKSKRSNKSIIEIDDNFINKTDNDNNNDDEVDKIKNYAEI